MKRRIILGSIFFLGLIYILTPEPGSIDNFPPLSDSIKSTDPGDTYQNPNIAAYYSDFDRDGITNFYKSRYREKFFWGELIPPISINYPPRAAYQYVKDLQDSIFLEEYVYPLHGSIFVNGEVPYLDNEIRKQPHTFLGDRIHINGRFFVSKTTLRYYPSDTIFRFLVYIGIWIGIFTIYMVARKVFRER